MPCIYRKLFVSCYFWTSLLLSFLHFWNFIYWLFKSVAKPDMLLGTASDHHCLKYCQKICAKYSQLKNVAVARPCKNHLHVASFTFLCSWLLYLMYICNLYSILYKQMTKKKDTKNECNYPLPISRLAAAHCLRH